MKTSVSLRDGGRGELRDCDTFTLAIKIPGQDEFESTPEMLAEYIAECSLRRIARGPDRDNYRGRKARIALALQRHPALCSSFA